MFDYIIVGAGSAGCVLAARLTEDPAVSVLLLEAGAAAVPHEVAVPAAFPKLFHTPCDWAYETEPQPRLEGRRLFWPRGRMLGGSSSMNAMIYVRGHPADYDGWRDLGNEGWGYEDVLPFFRRSEDQARGASEHHGAGGPLRVSDLRSVNPLSRAFLAAGEEIGLRRNPDFNGAGQDGVGLFQVTQRAGRRHSAADAFLRPALRRRNLEVWTGALATRVLFHGNRAAGVEMLREGRKVRALTRGEVILSGGAVNSPQLLLLSGVGPGDALRAHGIAVVVDLPGVGQGLQDHPAVPVIHDCLLPVSLDAAETLGNLARFLLLRRGPLTSNVAEAGAFVRTSPDLPAPDLQLHFGPAFFLDHGATRRPGHSFTLGPTLLTPRSRGRLSLRSADPTKPPRIQPDYLSDPEDLRRLVAGVRLARRLAATEAFAPYRGEELFPGPALEDDRALEAYVRAAVQTLYHPVGTCRMGGDRQAVVDARLRVRGVDGLRVIDASVMPEIVRGNTNAPTTMIAEKGADLLRGTGRRRAARAVRLSPPVG